MKKNKIFRMIKILLLIIIFGAFFFAGRDIYQSLVRVKKINAELVKSFRPQLDVGAIKKAVAILKKNS